jgi:tetratricopeptide (TPR) repeat protein
MLSLSNDGRYPALDLAPEQRRQRTLQALVSEVEKLADQRPVLMIFEDAHWSDPTSLEAFGRVIDRIASLRVLLLVTFRPEFAPPWIGQPHVTALTLNRLPKRDIDAMIDGVVGNKALPASIRQDIIERTDGIPLFVEEMAKAVLEAGSEGQAQQTAAAIPAPAAAVPASLQASLMARLDRLGPAKEIAQIGAAIGREFSHAVLTAVAGKPETELASALDRLIQSGLLFRQGLPPHGVYLFKHALIQDAAYGTLLREPRRALHTRIAEAIESQFAEIAESQPELLALHFTEAGLIERAASLWGKAAHRSLERSALVEAIGQFTRALAQIATLPPTPALRREEIKLQVALINPLFHVKGYAAPETETAAERARLLIEQAEALGEPPEDSLLLFSVLYSLCIANYVAFNGDVMCELAEQFLTLAEKQGSTVPLMIGHRLVGMSLLHIGDIAGGRAHHDRAIALYDPAEHRALTTRFGQDVRMALLSFRSLALWILGYPDRALADVNHAVIDAREIGQAATLMYALTTTASTLTLCGHYDAAKARCDEAVRLAEEKSATLWKGYGVMRQGYVMALTGIASDAVHTITSAITAWRSTGSTLWIPFSLSYLAVMMAEAFCAVGRHLDARRCLDEAGEIIERTDERRHQSDVFRVRGDLLLHATSERIAVEENYRRASASARRQNAKTLELRAATSLAKLWSDQRKRAEARELLAPVCCWFTEGFDTPVLQNAKALLDELSS